jgi:hypothetical protein
VKEAFGADKAKGRTDRGSRADRKAERDSAARSNSRSRDPDQARKGAKEVARATSVMPTTEAVPVEKVSLGRLNAAHASTQALANAAPNSAVGRIAAYRDVLDVKELDEAAIEDAAKALAAASNKPVTEDTVRALNGLLGIELDDQAVRDIVAKVESLKTSEAAGTSTAPAL